jgi:ABC-2 type transport system permease protein
MKEKLMPVMEADSYKKILPEYTQLQKSIRLINIVPNGPVGKQVTITDQKEITEFSRVIEKDLLSQTLDDLVQSTSPWGYIEISTKAAGEDHSYEGFPIEWKKSYDETTKWLDEHGYLDDARINIEDLLKAEITKVNLPKDLEYYNPDELFISGEQFFTITDKELLSKTLEHFTEYSEEHTYYIKFTLKDGNEWYGSIPDEDVPIDIQNKLK